MTLMTILSFSVFSVVVIFLAYFIVLSTFVSSTVSSAWATKRNSVATWPCPKALISKSKAQSLPMKNSGLILHQVLILVFMVHVE